MSVPTLGSLYAGVGGSDLGFERAGFRVAWQAECDPWRARVLAAHWDVPRARLVEDLDFFARAERVDLLCVTPPASDPEWLPPVWPILARLRPPFLVVTSAGRCAEALQAGFDATGYVGGVLNLTCEVRCGTGRVQRAQAFAVGARQKLPDSALGVRTFAASPRDDRDPRSVVEVFETLVGLPAGWTCVCGQSALACSESVARLLAANDCLSPALTEWVGRQLLAAMQRAAGLIEVGG